MDVMALIIVVIWLRALFRGEFQLSSTLKTVAILGVLFFINVALGFIVNGQWTGYFLKRQYEALWIFVPFGCYHLFSKLPLGSQINEKKILILFATLGAILLIPLGVYLVAGHDSPRYGGSFDDPMTFAHSLGMISVFLLAFAIGLQVRSWERFQETKMTPSIKPKSSEDSPVSAISSETANSLDKIADFKAPKKLLWAVWAFTILALVSTMLTMTRGVWIGVFAAICISCLYISKRFFILVAASGGALLTAFYFYWPAFQERVLFTLRYKDTNDAERVALWRSNFAMAQDYPIFGTGWGLNREHLLEYYAKLGIQGIEFQSHAHNQFLHFWAGTGTVGLLIYLSFFGFFLFKIHQMISRAQSQAQKFLLIGLFAVQIEFLVSGLTESNFERSRVRYLILLSWGLILWLWKIWQDNPHEVKMGPAIRL